MIVNCFAVKLVTVVLLSVGAMAIQCDFKYDVDDSPSTSAISGMSAVKRKLPPQPKGPLFEFICDDPLDDYVADNETRPGIGNRFDKDDDDYIQDNTECASSKKTIQPKNLNTVYNKLMDIVQNHTTFVQTIEIDTCEPKNTPCNNGGTPGPGRLIICRQKHVRITLKAFNDMGAIVDEQFYYPSHCICELVRKREPSERKTST